MKELREDLKDFSQRRMNAAVATALTRTAKTVSTQWQSQIDRRIDRPVARTMKAAGFTGANASKLESTVFLKDRMDGTAPAEYLQPQEFGGDRLLKKFERALIASGAMPSGYMTVPGRHATLDGNGNVSRAQLIAVIRALGSQYSPGYQQVISKSTTKRLAAQARHGRQYIAVNPQDARTYKLSPGIYERMRDGHRMAIFLFKSSVHYRKHLSLVDRSAVEQIKTTLDAELQRAINESLARLSARGPA